MPEATNGWHDVTSTPRSTASPLVSVVVPAWNAEATLARALSSALAQDYRPIEILVVDDGSTDGTRAVAESFAAAVRYLPRPHAGAAAARNAGIAEARGEFVAFLDADDEWLPTYLSHVLAPMLRDPAVGMAWTRALRRTPGGAETVFGRAFGRSKPFADRLWPPAEQCTPATVCRATVLRRAAQLPPVAQAFQPANPPQTSPDGQAGKPAPLTAANAQSPMTNVQHPQTDAALSAAFDPTLATREDQDLWIRMRELAPVADVAEPLVIVHARERAAETARNWPRIRADYYAILERALARRPGLYAPHAREIRAEADWHWGLMALKAGDTASARRALWLSLLRAPRLHTVLPALASLLPAPLLARLLRRVH